MKKILYILFLIIVGLLNSCGNKFLDVVPLNVLSDETFWKTENDATLALNGCYNDWEAYLNIVCFDSASDNGWDSAWGYAKFGNGTLTPATYDQVGPWVDSSGPITYHSEGWFLYTKIRKYNNFLARINSVTMDTTKRTEYKAEVRFLRAYDYFWKVMLHGDMPLVTKIILADAKLKRDPAATVKQFILDELAEIAPLLPVQNTIDSQGHVTRGAALALKARLELYMGNFAAAQTDAKAVIDMSCYELYPDYRNLFLPASTGVNKECILGANFIVNDYPDAWQRASSPDADGGWSVFNATKSIADAYECSNGKTIDDPTSGYDINNPFQNRDPRLAMSIWYPGQLWNGRYYNSLDQFLPNGTQNLDYHGLQFASPTGMNVKKYVDPLGPGQTNWPPNFGDLFMCIRLAEMYLTYAEAAVETGTNTGQALQYINLIRNRVGQIQATSLTKDLVRRERRVELAFEGLRYFDIMRWDLGAQVLSGPLYGSRLGTIDANGKVTWKGDGKLVNIDNYMMVETRVFNPARKYLFPVPQMELDANPNMVQNPGY